MYKNKIALVVVSLLAVAGCDSGGTKKDDTVSAPVLIEAPIKPSISVDVPFDADNRVGFQNIAVHDPSIVEDSGTYYIFGSHLAAAKSTDLISWEYISSLSANNAVDESSLFDNSYTTEISEGIEWTDGFTGNWAADVIKAPNGKYWFYYNHCAQDNPDTAELDEVCWNRSYLGLAESDSIEGPYVDKGIFIRSGYRTAEEFVAYPLDNGQDTYNQAVDPNAIDPAAYYDKDDNLWMVYGSYSGGIFVLAMDEETGMPEAGQGYGTRLVGGSFRAMEGAFSFYSPESDYYYLMFSVAGFAVNDGYNIRVARSRNPQGPYYDPAGNDIANAEGLAVGAKLMGGFEYTQELGDEEEAWGYQSPGHNSAYYDEVTGRHILVTHTRFPSTSTKFPTIPEAHEVRVHEMFINKDGWLVASPQRFVPLDSDNIVGIDDVMGYYKFVNHGVDVNSSAIRSTHIALNADHSVTGSETGAWSLVDPENINLKLATGTYVGSVKWQWDDARAELVPTFSALAQDGSMVWGSKVSDINDTATTLSEIHAALEVPDELSVNDLNYKLTLQAKDGAIINWTSSDNYYVNVVDGSVFIPTPDRGNKTLTLNAEITLNGQTTTKSFEVTLIARSEFVNAIAHYQFEDNVSDTLAGFDDATVTSSNMEVAGGVEQYAVGQTGQSFDFDGATGVKLDNQIINSDSYTISFWSNPTELAVHTPALFMSETGNYDRWITFAPSNVWFTTTTAVWSRYLDDNLVDDWNQIVAAESVVYNEWTHYALSYGEGVMKLYINGVLAGSMPRPDFFGGMGGDFALGTGYGWDPSYRGKIDEVIIYDYELNSLDINAAAINNLTDPNDFPPFIKDALDLGDTSAVKSSFSLPRVGPFVSGISWSAPENDFFKVENGQAIVTQPAPAAGDQQITLTATIRYKELTDTKVFEVTVKSLAPAEYSFEGDLSALDGVAADGIISGDRIGNTGGTISYTEGIEGQALLLDGTSGVRLPDNLVTSQQYSISVWLKPTVMTDYTTAFFGASDANNWISIVPQLNNTDAGPLNSSAVWVSSGGWWNDFNFGENVFSPEEWTHIVVIVDGSNAKVYLNGVETLSNSEFPNLFALGLTTQWAIGVNYWDTPFNGAVDELKFFYETIDTDKVTELYSVGAQ
ncbi:MAG: family 43 glycosylhydrolase [Kangiellaceae bacterium]|nr:family 43 glycosylhydrolase [Kangiellaceae bacterium]